MWLEAVGGFHHAVEGPLKGGPEHFKAPPPLIFKKASGLCKPCNVDSMLAASIACHEGWP